MEKSEPLIGEQAYRSQTNDTSGSVLTDESAGQGQVSHDSKMGHQMKMKKQFGMVATLGVAFAILNSWVAVAATMLAPISLGGPVTIIWGAVAAAFFAGAISIGVAELASAYPHAGGPYHYTFMVAGARIRKFLTFFTGWTVTVAWWFIISSVGIFMATFIMGMVILVHEDFVPTAWQTWLLSIATVVLHTAVVIFGNSIMSRLTTASIYWSLGSFIVCLVATVALHHDKPYASASFVFGTFSNTSGWSNNGLAFVIGLMLNTFNFLGLDAATHISEEIPRPEVEVPRAMLTAVALGFVTALAFLIALLFCVTDIEAIQGTLTGVPVLEIFYQASGSKPAAIVLCVLVAISISFSLISCIVVAGRTTWAFARDNGLPFSKYFGEIDQRAHLPVRATVISSVVAIGYAAIYIGSSVAFQSFIGSICAMLFTIYAIPQAILALRGRDHLPPRPFDLGKLGLFFNVLAPVLALFCTIILCFPIELPVEAESMNYFSVIVFGSWAFIILFYIFVKKGKFTGPSLNYDNHSSPE